MAKKSNPTRRKPRTVTNDRSPGQSAEEALRQSEENWRILFESTLDSLVIVDAATMTGLLCNQNYAGLCGFDRVEDAERAINVNAFDFIHADERHTILETVLHDVFDEDSRQIREFHTMSSRGSELWISTVATRIDYHGTPAALVSVRDITGRKRAEAQLQAVQERYKTVFENSAVAITVTDARERIIAWNTFAELLLGMDWDDLHLKPVRSLYPKEEWKRIRAENVRRKGMQHHLETRIIKKSKDVIDVDISLSVLKDPDGEVTGSIGVIRDITERKDAEAQLRVVQENYRTVFENSAVAITVTDAKERIIAWNKFAEHLLGMDKDDLYLKPVRSLYPKDEWLRIRTHNVRKKGMQHHLETRIIKKNKEIIDVDISISVLKGPDGEVTGSIGVIRDITERMKVQEVIRTQRDLGLSLCHADGLDDGLRLCLEAAIKVSDMDSGGVYLVDGATGALDMAVHSGLPEDFVEASSHFDADSANVGIVMEGSPVYTSHRELNVSLDKARGREQLRAVAVVPVTDASQVIGCLNVASHTLDEVSSFGRDALETIASQIGSAIARLKAVAALQEAEQKWRSLVENSSDFIVILDRDGTILSINHTAPGFTSEEAIGKSTYDFTDPEYHAIIRETIEEVWRTGVAGSYETEGQGPHGAHAWYETQVVPLKKEGRIDAVLQISSDITMRKLIEGDEELVKLAFQEHSGVLSGLYLELEAAKKALHGSEERYRCVAETANDALISIDDRGNVIQWNPKAGSSSGRLLSRDSA
jgi:PAS domain S-box-containing protein